MYGLPSNTMIPIVSMDFDGSQANEGSSDMPVKLLMIGQRLSTGSVAALTKYKPANQAEIGVNSGLSSMLYSMGEKLFKNGRSIDVTVLALDDKVAGVAAIWTTSITGTATRAGELPAYVKGRRYVVNVEVGETGAGIVALLVAAILEDQTNMPFTPSVGSPTTSFVMTAKHKGVAAGDLDIRFCHNPGEVIPAGITIGTPTLSTAGTVDPDISDALAVIGDDWFNVIVSPYSDTTNMDDLEDYLEEQFSVLYQKGGICYQAKRDTRANLMTFASGVSRNSRCAALLPAYKFCESTWDLAAGVGAAVAESIQDDPAVPLHRIALKGFLLQHPDDKWDDVERNQLAMSGCCTFTQQGGAVQTEAMITMYLTNSAGASDNTYQQQNSIFELLASRYAFVNQINTKYPRAKLTSNADNIGPGQQIMSIDIAKAEAIVWFGNMQYKGIFEGGADVKAQFIRDLRVVRDIDNKNRINWLVSPDMMNQFIVGSIVSQFRG